MSIGSGKWIESLRLCEHEEFDALSSVDQIDVACDAFERAWQDGRGLGIEEFIADAPLDSQTKHRLIEELIPLEFDFLTEARDFGSYLTRFPHHGLYLARFFCDEAQQQALGYPLPQCGKYVLLEKVGQGSFGVVYRGYDQKLDRFVAVKLPTGDLGDQSGIRRFLREAKNAGRLCGHPGIVAVHLVGEDERGQPYLVSDFVEGETLQEYLAAPRQLNLRTAASLVAQVAEAVDYAHQHNIIHRDLKPSNIMLEQRKIGDSTADATPDDSLRPRVLDFGLARRQDADASASLHGAVVGTPAYMSPEQARGAADVDHRADVYSLGAILYELVFGERCFPGESFSAVLLQVVGEEPKVPRTTTKSIPQDLVTICLKCLNKAPKDRYGSAAELAADLRRWLRYEEITARPRTRIEKTVRWVARNKAISVAGVAAALLICTIATTGVLKLQEAAHDRVVTNLDAASFEDVRDYVVKSRDQGLKGFELLAVRRLISHPDTRPRLRRRARFLLRDAPVAVDTLLADFDDASPEEAVFFARLRAANSASDNDELVEVVCTWSDDDDGLLAGIFLAAADDGNDIWQERAPEILEALRQQQKHRDAWCRAFQPVAGYFIAASRNLVATDASWPVEVSRLLFEREPTELVWLLQNVSDFAEYESIVAAIGKHGSGDIKRALENAPEYAPWHELTVELRAESLAAIKNKTKLVMAYLALSLEDLDPLRHLLASDVDPRARTYFIQHAKYGLPATRLCEILLACDESDENDANLLYCAALALAQYRGQTLSNRVKEHLIDTFSTHPDPGVHSAMRFVLCKTGHLTDVRELEVSGGFPYERGCRWFYSPVGICMIVVKAGTYVVPTESGPWEIELFKTIAVAATEFTEGQYDLLLTGRRSESQFPKAFTHVISLLELGKEPNVESSVSSLIDTCRLADRHADLRPPGCFAMPEDPEVLIQCDLNAVGHRYPTYGEWLVINHAGGLTPFYFGTNDGKADGLMHEKSLAKSRNVATFAPNRYGFFDTQGGLRDISLTPFRKREFEGRWLQGKWRSRPESQLVHRKSDSSSSMGGGNSFSQEWADLSIRPFPAFIGDASSPGENYCLRLVQPISGK